MPPENDRDGSDARGNINSMQPSNTIRSDTIQVLFAGGCHTIGYPVGEQFSFPTVTRQCLAQRGVSIAVERLPYVKLTHREKLIDKCRQVNPDVLVLQLGHLELHQPLWSYLWAVIRRKAPPRPKAPSGTPQPYRTTQLGFRLKYKLKGVLDRLLGHPLVDLPKFDRQLSALAESVAPLGIPVVVLLTPLRCADPTGMYYRLAVRRIYRRIAAEHGFLFLDMLDGTPDPGTCLFGAEQYYFDPMHLAAEGQRTVGEALAASLALPLRNLVEKWLVQ